MLREFKVKKADNTVTRTPVIIITLLSQQQTIDSVEALSKQLHKATFECNANGNAKKDRQIIFNHYVNKIQSG